MLIIKKQQLKVYHILMTHVPPQVSLLAHGPSSAETNNRTLHPADNKNVKIAIFPSKMKVGL